MVKRVLPRNKEFHSERAWFRYHRLGPGCQSTLRSLKKDPLFSSTSVHYSYNSRSLTLTYSVKEYLSVSPVPTSLLYLLVSKHRPTYSLCWVAQPIDFWHQNPHSASIISQKASFRRLYHKRQRVKVHCEVNNSYGEAQMQIKHLLGQGRVTPRPSG